MLLAIYFAFAIVFLLALFLLREINRLSNDNKKLIEICSDFSHKLTYIRQELTDLQTMRMATFVAVNAEPRKPIQLRSAGMPATKHSHSPGNVSSRPFVNNTTVVKDHSNWECKEPDKCVTRSNTYDGGNSPGDSGGD